MNEMKLILNLKEGLFTLNDGTLDALGRPRQVQLLINVKKKMLAVRACHLHGHQRQNASQKYSSADGLGG